MNVLTAVCSTVCSAPESSDHLRVQLREGGSPEALFEQAIRHDCLEFAIELADTGAVSPEVVMRYALKSSAPAYWMVVAARSAAMRGDQRVALQLATRSIEVEGEDAALAGFARAVLARRLAPQYREALLSEIGGER